MAGPSRDRRFDRSATAGYVERQPQHLWRLLLHHKIVVAVFGEKVKAETLLYTSCTASTLLRIGAGNERLGESRELPAFIKSHFFVFACVDDTSDIRNSNTGFRNIGCKNYLSHSRWWNEEGSLLLLTRNG